MSSITNLILFRNGQPVSVYFLQQDAESTIGRSPENTILLNDERCSRFHAKVIFQENQWFLTDLNSRNGTAVNDVRVSEPTPLQNGDRIQIGHEILYFCIVTPNIPETELTSNDLSSISESVQQTLSISNTLLSSNERLNEKRELTARLNRTQSENRFLRSLLNQESEIIGKSVEMQEVGHLIDRAAQSKATVLIRGESGVGKELVARAIHEASPRNGQNMICLNCAALSESLLASELFGHERGAFTDATERKIGKFEAAHQGTLFLDEIAEMSPAIQAKFLRVLEGQSFERVGGTHPISVDVRVIAATNRHLEEEVAAGRFRHDLFFRLHVLEICVPPLRKRIADIQPLAYYFLEKFSRETKRRFQGFAPATLETLRSYRWPGNVRELKNIIERAVLLSNHLSIEPEDLLLSTLPTTGNTSSVEHSVPNAASSALSVPPSPSEKTFFPISLEDMERELIQKTLEFFHWNKSNTAKSLGVERTTLDRKIAKYGIKKS